MPLLAQGQDFALTQIEAPPAAGQDIFLGPSLFSYEPVPGSSKQRWLGLPMLEAFGNQGWFLSTLAGAGWNFSHDTHWQYGLRLTPEFPRLASDTVLPDVVSNIGLRLERGAFLNALPWDFLVLQSGFRQGAGKQQDGLLFDSGLSTGLPLGKHATLALTSSATWGNRSYAQSYFGVPANAAGVASYAPAAGLLKVNTDLLLLADITPRWSLTVDAGRSRYCNGAAASPLLQERVERLWFAGLEYHF